MIMPLANHHDKVLLTVFQWCFFGDFMVILWNFMEYNRDSICGLMGFPGIYKHENWSQMDIS